MATSDPQTDDLSLCLMCLEAPGEHKIGLCDHRYCKTCLTSHFERQIKDKNAVIACPACQTLPVTVCDSTPNVASQTQGTTAFGEADTEQNKTATPKGGAKMDKIMCKLCRFKGKSVSAINMCKVCRDVPLCMKCSKAHRESSRTKGHVVVRLSAKEEVLCSTHDEPLELFCKTCSKVMCHICGALEHSEHQIETFNDVVFVEVDGVGKALKSEEGRLKTMQADKKNLEESKETAEQMQEAVMKAIEDHVDKCVDAILKKKEELKEKVRNDFQVIGVLTKRLEAMPELLKASEKIIAEATRLMDREAELHSSYVEKLVHTKQELAKLDKARHAYDEEKEAYQKSFEELCKDNWTFHPQNPDFNIGSIEKGGSTQALLIGTSFPNEENESAQPPPAINALKPSEILQAAAAPSLSAVPAPAPDVSHWPFSGSSIPNIDWHKVKRHTRKLKF